MNELAIDVDLYGPAWITFGSTSVRGCAHLDDRFLSAAELAQRLDACESPESWQRTLSRFNGSFAAVTRRDDALLAAVDRVRSIPLFYRIDGSSITISDNAHRIVENVGETFANAAAKDEFLLTGYVTGHETLLRDVHQVQAGELICRRAEQPDAPLRRRYYTFEHGDYFRSDSKDLIERLEMVHERVFRRLLTSVGGRPIAIPLSGGHDSRLIGLSLRDMGARDVICYSYGSADNWEAKISKELAGYLGFRWEFVPYSPQRWRTWSASEPFRAYFRTAGNLTSVPHFQDWPAVWELQRGRKIAPDTVFVPGHTGDFLTGGHIPTGFTASPMVRRHEFFAALYRAHYSLWDWPERTDAKLRRAFDGRVESVIGRVGDCSAARAADLFEQWELRERQAKFICNSVRVYEFFGYEWRLPLFDHELMEFWARIPLEQRVGRKLYFEFARDRQQLPVTEANKDRNAALRGAIRAIEAARLKPLAKRVQHLYRTFRWQEQYTSSPLSWLAIVDPDYFKSTYTGKQIAHSYVALAYRDWALPRADGTPSRHVIPAMERSRSRSGADIA